MVMVSMRGAGLGSTFMVSVTTTRMVSYTGMDIVCTAFFLRLAAMVTGAHSATRTSSRMVRLSIILLECKT